MLMSTDESVRRQHEAVRTTAGWFCFTHHLIEVAGPDAAVALDRMCTGAIASLAVGRERYTMILDDKGIIQDDIIIFRIAEETFWISTLHINRELIRLKKLAEALDFTFARITEAWEMYSVQGPQSLALVNAVVDEPVDDLRFFSIRDNHVGDVAVKVARSGFTGEKFGYEIYVPAPQVDVLVEKLRSNQDSVGAVEVDEIDVMVFSLSAEKGYVLMSDIHRCNPFEVGMEKSIDFSKEEFAGKSAVLELRDKPCTRKLVSVVFEDQEVLAYGGPKGAHLFKGGVDVGRLTRLTYGATVGSYIGFALIDTRKAQVGDEVTIEGYPATIKERPLL
ncbi:MAG: aminomethyltransferase family protein [Eggerthellaceae bacterium]|nr:aminomethyltransferase family protein [Eggerthellaceae bacterium]